MVLHPTVSAVSTSTLVMTVSAKTAGIEANSIITTETVTGGSWANTTLTGGLENETGAGNDIPTLEGLTNGSWSSATLLGGTDDRGLIELFLNMPFTIQVGDEFRVYAGCDKRLATCRDKFDNIVNMRAEPFLPGTDAITRTPNAR